MNLAKRIIRKFRSFADANGNVHCHHDRYSVYNYMPPVKLYFDEDNLTITYNRPTKKVAPGDYISLESREQHKIECPYSEMSLSKSGSSLELRGRHRRHHLFIRLHDPITISKALAETGVKASIYLQVVETRLFSKRSYDVNLYVL